MLTGAIDVALGAGAAGVFTNSENMWNKLQKVNVHQTTAIYIISGNIFFELFICTCVIVLDFWV